MIKEARIAAGYTQKGLADSLGLEYYTMISQIELGYMSLPPSLWTPLADKLRMPRAAWVLNCLLEIQPEVYTALFGIKSVAEVTEVLDRLDKGDACVCPVHHQATTENDAEANEGRVSGRA